MSAIPVQRFFTLEQYLEREELSEEKHEFFDGEIFAMAGSTPAHARITMNLGGEVHAGTKGRGCQVWSPDLRVKVKLSKYYTYPDLAAVCGTPEYERVPGRRSMTLLNPTLLAEVLSDSSEVRDRGFKFSQYRTLESLREYVLVAQDEPLVEVWTRGPEGYWRPVEYRGLDAVLRLESLGVSIPLAELYRDIDFPPPKHPLPGFDDA